MAAPTGSRLLQRLPGLAKVAVLRPGRIGDFVCATPALRALRRAEPKAEITFIGLPLVAPLASRCSSIDRFVPFPGFPGIAEQLFEPAEALAFLSEMQAERFDLAIQLYGSGVYANPVALLLGARATAGFVRPEDTYAGLDAALPLPETGHEIARVLSLVAFLGAEPDGCDPRLERRPGDREIAAQLLGAPPRPIVGFHAGARERDRRWPPAQLVRVASMIREKHGGTIVFLGSNDGGGESSWPQGGVDLVGKTSLDDLTAVIGALDLLVAADSGPAHIAYALGTPTVTGFLASDPDRWSPPPSARHAVVTVSTDGDEAGRDAASSVLARGAGS